MGVARNLLCSTPSFPAKTHLKHSLPPPSSVLMLHEQAASSAPSVPTTSVTRHFPTSVLLQEQREECRPLLHSSSDDKVSQEIAEKSQMEAAASATDEVIDGDLRQSNQIYEWQLLQLPGLWNLLSSTEAKEDSLLSLTIDSTVDFEPCDVVSLVRKALSASEQAALLSDEAKVHGLEFDNSLDTCFGAGEAIAVRSTRLHERRSKKRREPKPNLDDNMFSPRSFRVRRKLSRASYQDDPVRRFVSGSKSQLLTVEEESELVVRVQDLKRLKRAKSMLQSQYGREPKLVEWANAVGVSCHVLQSELLSGNRSRERLIHANLRMVVHVAKGYTGHGLSLQDLLQEGSLGLMYSIEKYVPQEGCRFSTYAFWWIRQSIRKALFKHSRTIRLPGNAYTFLRRLAEARRSCKQEGECPPSNEELARHIGIKVEKLEKMLVATRLPRSLQQPVWSDQDTTFQDITADTKIETPDVSVGKELMRKHLQNLLSRLSPRERKIVRLRFGIEGGKQTSLAEIGHKFGITSERVRQLEKSALYKLKQCLGEHGESACIKFLL